MAIVDHKVGKHYFEVSKTVFSAAPHLCRG